MTNIQDENGYNQIYKSCRAQKIRLERRVNAILENLNLNCKSILELGCGNGELSHILAKNIKNHVSITAIDSSSNFIKYAKENFSHPQIQFIQHTFDKNSLTFINDYDAIIGNGMLHHLYYSLDSSLQQIHQKLNPHGKLIFWEPNFFNPYVFVTFNFPYFRKLACLDPDEMAFTATFIQEKLITSNFKNIQIQYRDFLLPNTPSKLIPSIIKIEKYLEKSFLRYWAQSILIYAEKDS